MKTKSTWIKNPPWAESTPSAQITNAFFYYIYSITRLDIRLSHRAISNCVSQKCIPICVIQYHSEALSTTWLIFSSRGLKLRKPLQHKGCKGLGVVTAAGVEPATN